MAFAKALLSCLAVVLVLSSASEAREFLVGKEKSWKVPTDSHNSFNAWASGQRFLKGDHLLFKYDGKSDSVVEVNYDGYKNCDARKPLKAYNNGYTSVELKGAGPFYFISGNIDNCQKGEKLEVMLVNDHHHGHHGGHIAPAPSPSTTTTTPTNAPAPAPASGSNSLKNGFLSIALVFGLGFWL